MTWTKDEFDKIYSRYLESGLSVRSFCFNEGINESRFFFWKRRTITGPELGLQTAGGTFLPVNVAQRDGKITIRSKAVGSDFRKWTNYFLEHIHEYDNDYSRPLDDFLPATLKERGLV